MQHGDSCQCPQLPEAATSRQLRRPDGADMGPLPTAAAQARADNASTDRGGQLATMPVIMVRRCAIARRTTATLTGALIQMGRAAVRRAGAVG